MIFVIGCVVYYTVIFGACGEALRRILSHRDTNRRNPWGFVFELRSRYE